MAVLGLVVGFSLPSCRLARLLFRRLKVQTEWESKFRVVTDDQDLSDLTGLEGRSQCVTSNSLSLEDPRLPKLWLEDSLAIIP